MNPGPKTLALKLKCFNTHTRHTLHIHTCHTHATHTNHTHAYTRHTYTHIHVPHATHTHMPHTPDIHTHMPHTHQTIHVTHTQTTHHAHTHTHNTTTTPKAHKASGQQNRGHEPCTHFQAKAGTLNPTPAGDGLWAPAEHRGEQNGSLSRAPPSCQDETQSCGAPGPQPGGEAARPHTTWLATVPGRGGPNSQPSSASNFGEPEIVISPLALFSG